MSSGFGFFEILISEVTMVIMVVVFLCCCFLLLFKRKKIDLSIKIISTIAIFITGIYLVFIIWAIIGWGSSTM